MDIHITRKGEQHGPYPEANAREMLAAGQLLPTDLAWHAGADGWKPLSEVLGAATQPPATPPPSPPPPGGGIPKRTMAGAAPAEEKPAEEKPEDSEPEDPDKISVTRKGEPIGPYSREKAKEYFASGQLLPTDWGWHDGMDDWKPINEVLGMAAPAQATAAVGKSGKGKKVAMIVGIVVLVSGLIFAGITYGPDLVAKVSGGGKIETQEELVNLAMEAIKADDKDALRKLTTAQFSKGQLNDLADDMVNRFSEKFISQVAEGQGKTADEVKNGLRKDMREALLPPDEEQSKEKFKQGDKRYDNFRAAMENAGVDWSDVTVSKVDFKPKRTKLDNLTLKAESSIKEGRADVTITSKGKNYNIRLDYTYTPSLGWFLTFVGLPTR
jgi:hypothetical protein